MASKRNGESPFVSIQVPKTDANWYIFFRLLRNLCLLVTSKQIHRIIKRGMNFETIPSTLKVVFLIFPPM